MGSHEFISKQSGEIDFAIFPEITHGLGVFKRAPVRLQFGDPRWGAVHIEKRDARELLRLKMNVQHLLLAS